MNTTHTRKKSQAIMTEFVKFCWALAVFGLLQQSSESLPSISFENNGFIGKARDRSLFQAREEEKDDICLTRGCVKAAAVVINNMDQSVNPCDDFYQFACGNFINQTIIDEDKDFKMPIIANIDSVMNKIKMIVTEPIQPNEQKPLEMAKLFYKSCMDTTQIEIQGLTSIKKMLKKLGGWPVLEGKRWNESDFTWKDSVYKFRTAGYSVNNFIDFSVVSNVKVRTIILDQPTLELDRKDLVNGTDNKLVFAYYRYMVDIAVVFGADRQRAEKDLKWSLDFESCLANISMSSKDRRNRIKKMNIVELKSQFPSIPWQEYLDNLLHPSTIRSDDIIVVKSPKYLSELETLLSKTPRRIQANYVIWRAVASSVPYLTEKLRKRKLEYSIEVSKRFTPTATPRWKECVYDLPKCFDLAIGSAYVRRYFNKDSKNKLLKMTKGIREEMYKILESDDWLDKETREYETEKLMSMTSYIAYPDELLDDSKLNEYYKELGVSDQNYYMSVLQKRVFREKKMLKTDWALHSNVLEVNAQYSPFENSIEVLAGIIQGVLFSSDRPRYMNYGAIGYVIGHEISHGFDDDGRMYDKDGNEVYPWPKTTEKCYLDKLSCIIEQYDNYTADVGYKLNGERTLNDNIADNTGVKLAYYAYNRWAQRNCNELRLPGLQEYSPQQMFWLSAANVWCSKYGKDALAKFIKYDIHSPGRFRVIGPLSNLEEFSHDFACPPGSKMNPEKKCPMW